MTLVRDRLGVTATAPIAVAAAALVAAMGGLAVGSGRGMVALGLAAVPLALFVVPRLSRAAGLPAGYFSIEVPIVLLLLSTLVFRARDAEALAGNPLDNAAVFRVGCVGAAALLAWLALLRQPLAAERVRLPPAVFVFGMYVAVAFLGAPLSSNLMLTAYRGVELAVGLLVVVAATTYGGAEAIRRAENAILAFILVLIASVWVGLLVAPGQALQPNVEPLPYQLQGVFPLISSNSVGELGAIIFLWAIGMRLSGRGTGRWNLFLIGLGATTLVAGQYRTGYVATAAALALLLAIRGRKLLALAMVVAALVAVVWNASSIVNAAEPYVLRGQSREQAAKLSGRISFWSHAIPVWRESPVLGKGLLTATRFEVLAPLGFVGTSTIHGTWVEALVGTGVIGVGLLAAFVVLLWRAGLEDLLSRRGLVYPGLLVAFFTVKSITGTSFEIFGQTTLLMLVLAYVLRMRQLESTRGVTMADPRRPRALE